MVNTISRFGECSLCGARLEAVWFTEYEYNITDSIIYKTGRKRHAVDYLFCPKCNKKFCVDDSFDSCWY